MITLSYNFNHNVKLPENITHLTVGLSEPHKNFCYQKI